MRFLRHVDQVVQDLVYLIMLLMLLASGYMFFSGRISTWNVGNDVVIFIKTRGP